jgi:hypothetical protein
MSRRAPIARLRPCAGPFALCLFAGALLGLAGCLHTGQARLQSEEVTDRERYADVKTVGDLTTVGNVVPIRVAGVGLVEGLEGTGGDSKPSTHRTMLLEELRKEGEPNTRKVLSSPENALVIVYGLIPPGARAGDKIDLQVKLPEGSFATSLRGGRLRKCKLYNYSTTRNLSSHYAGPPSLLMGHPLMWAEGKILVGLGAGEDGHGLKAGRIWAGGTCRIDHPFSLLLNPDQQYGRVAYNIAIRVNETFQGSFRAAPDEKVALARDNLAVGLRVPSAYRFNLPRYLRVVRFIPLAREAPRSRPGKGKPTYVERLKEDLNDPARCVIAALRLEALGEKSKPILKACLAKDKDPLVRFASAEALAYLGSPSAADTLARSVAEHPEYRAFALSALASLDEAVSQNKLVTLMTTSADDETRYGAFRALRALNERHPALHGEMLNGAFSLHEVAPATPPMVHISTTRQAEIVLFGPPAEVRPPLTFAAGEFTVTASKGDGECVVCRFFRDGEPVRRECSLRVADILRTMAALGGTYPEAVALLEQAKGSGALTARVETNCLPQATTVYDLVRLGRRHKKEGIGKDEPDADTALGDLGITPTLYQMDPEPGTSLIRTVGGDTGE